MKVQFDDVKLARKFAALVNALEGENRYQVTLAGAEAALDVALVLVPVDTGELQNSLGTGREGDDALLLAGTDHAEPVEFGTSRMAAQPYLRPAGDAPQVAQAIMAAAKKQLLAVCDG